MGKKGLLKDIGLNILITLILNIFLFLINKYFLKNLGIRNLGLMKLFTQMMMYLNIVESGIGVAGTYALYKPIVEKNFLKVSIIINTISILYKKISILILLIGLICNFLLPFLINDILDKSIYLYWSLYVINLSISYCYVKYNILFIASQEYNLTRIIDGTGKIVCYTLQLIVIMILKNFYIFIIMMYLDTILQYFMYKYFFKKKYLYIVKTNKVDISIRKNMKNLLLHKLGGIFVFNVDLILITKFVSLDAVGIYASYQMVTQIFGVGINMILNIVRPKIGKYMAINSKETIYRFWRKYNILYLFVCLFLTLCTNYLLDPFIKFWLGDGLFLEKNIKILIVFNMFVLYFRKFIELIKETNGFFNDIEAPIIEATLKIMFSLILGKTLGLEGILMGTAISNTVIILLYKPILIFKNCFNQKKKEYIKIYGQYLLLVLLSLAFFRILEIKNIEKNIKSWLDWIVYATTISVITGVVLFVVFLLNKDFRNIIKTYVLKRK